MLKCLKKIDKKATGCAAVHAMSYPLGARYHVPHGESNYAIFTEVLKTYLRLAPDVNQAYVEQEVEKQQKDAFRTAYEKWAEGYEVRVSKSLLAK